MSHDFKGALEKIVQKVKEEKNYKDAILKTWNEIKQDYVLHARPSSLYKKILYIDVEDSNWLYFCVLKNREIKEHFKKFFSQGVIRDVKFRVRQ